jgi:hypothetical protein
MAKLLLNVLYTTVNKTVLVILFKIFRTKLLKFIKPFKGKKKALKDKWQ